MSDAVRTEASDVLERVALRPIGLAVFTLVPSTVIATSVLLLRPGVSADELTAVTAVPIIVFYVSGRVLAAFVAPPSTGQKQRFQHLQRRAPKAIRTLVDIQASTLIAGFVGVCSAAIYFALGIDWSWQAALRLSGVLVGVSAAACVICGLAVVAMESAKDGVVRQCKVLGALCYQRLANILNVLAGSFKRHTGLHSAH